MKTPDQVRASLQKRFHDDYPDWARGRGHWPMRIPLNPPTTLERATRTLECHTWAHQWQEYSGPGTVTTKNLKFPTGTHAMPRTLVMGRPGDVAAIDPTTAAVWDRCGERLVHLQQRFPRARFDRIIRRITDLTESDYRRLLDTITWLKQHPTSGMLLRQLPIEGVGTKWLATHATLVLAMLGDHSPDATSEPDEPGTSIRIRLHQRLGLRVPPELLNIAVLDPTLRSHLAGMRHFAAGIEDLDRWQHTPSTVLILENNETAYAITADHPGTVVLHGQGFSVSAYARITWIRSAHNIIYWGDIDLPGLEFINDLRALNIPARSILMDLPTLNAYHHLAIPGADSRRTQLPHLTDAERELHNALIEYRVNHHEGLLLEQERIPWNVAHQALENALNHQRPH